VKTVSFWLFSAINAMKSICDHPTAAFENGPSQREYFNGRYRLHNWRSLTCSATAHSVQPWWKRFVSFLSLSGRGKRRVTRQAIVELGPRYLLLSEHMKLWGYGFRAIESAR
jgi:hypothetical protein